MAATHVVLATGNHARRALLGYALLEARYDVVCVDNGAAALRFVFERSPALLVTELKLPVLDGWQLIRHVRRARIAVRILAIAGKRIDEATLAARGVDAFLSKPLDPEKFIDTVQCLIDRTVAEQAYRPVGLTILRPPVRELAVSRLSRSYLAPTRQIPDTIPKRMVETPAG